MKYPLSTGQAASILGRTEKQIQDLIRRGRIEAPQAIAGRRQWHRAEDEAATAESCETTVLLVDVIEEATK